MYATCVSANAVIKAYRDKMHNPKTPSPINSKDFDSVVTIPERYRNYSDRTDTVRLETVTGRNTDLDNDPPRGTYKYKYWTQHLNSGGTIQRCSKIPLSREEKAEWKREVCYHDTVLLVCFIQLLLILTIIPIVPLVLFVKVAKR